MRDNLNIPSKQELLQQLFASFCTGIRSKKSEKPRRWLEERGLNYLDLQIGFNSGQFHHRKNDEFRNNYLRIGVLKESNASVKSPELKAYSCYGAYSIVFPLKDERGDIVNLYAIRINLEEAKMEYLNDEGLYPRFPSILTTRLYITNNILDAASLIQSKVMENRDAVLALHDGQLKGQHIEAIKKLNHLKQIIFIRQHENNN